MHEPVAFSILEHMNRRSGVYPLFHIVQEQHFFQEPGKCMLFNRARNIFISENENFLYSIDFLALVNCELLYCCARICSSPWQIYLFIAHVLYYGVILGQMEIHLFRWRKSLQPQQIQAIRMDWISWSEIWNDNALTTYAIACTSYNAFDQKHIHAHLSLGQNRWLCMMLITISVSGFASSLHIMFAIVHMERMSEPSGFVDVL